MAGPPGDLGTGRRARGRSIDSLPPLAPACAAAAAALQAVSATPRFAGAAPPVASETSAAIPATAFSTAPHCSSPGPPAATRRGKAQRTIPKLFPISWLLRVGRKRRPFAQRFTTDEKRTDYLSGEAGRRGAAW